MDPQTLKHEVERFDPAVPLDAAWTPPASWYRDPAFRELEAVLRS